MLRGANKQEIFHDDEDCMTFLETVEKYKIKSEMDVFAWCLMNNHVHLLLKEGNEDISTTMKRIGVSFVWYYNLKYKTTGHLFQDRFKSENVETYMYLLRVIRYIHQNPVKAGIAKTVDEWRWSSCSGYYGQKVSFSRFMLDEDVILRMFSDDVAVAKMKFKEFNEKTNDDECLDDRSTERKRFTDEEARMEIKKILGEVEIAQVKSLPKLKRDIVLRETKEVEGISQRQAARIFGVSPNLVFRA
ncbi:transposase [Salipaludibacillus sp. CF4.18]|uniref:transposase n=1 Tax=Salipaludibacillus sp. CF4.18 TaxID=3373081 RepID=UPI003EE74B80